MSANKMQEAFMAAAVAGPSRLWVNKVVRVADKQPVRPLRDTVKLSYRTAGALRSAGVIG